MPLNESKRTIGAASAKTSRFSPPYRTAVSGTAASSTSAKPASEAAILTARVVRRMCARSTWSAASRRYHRKNACGRASPTSMSDSEMIEFRTPVTPTPEAPEHASVDRHEQDRDRLVGDPSEAVDERVAGDAAAEAATGSRRSLTSRRTLRTSTIVRARSSHDAARAAADRSPTSCAVLPTGASRGREAIGDRLRVVAHDDAGVPHR